MQILDKDKLEAVRLILLGTKHEGYSFELFDLETWEIPKHIRYITGCTSALRCELLHKTRKSRTIYYILKDGSNPGLVDDEDNHVMFRLYKDRSSIQERSKEISSTFSEKERMIRFTGGMGHLFIDTLRS